MSSLDSLNRALDYIDDNLAGDIDFRQVERLALCSEYHFSPDVLLSDRWHFTTLGKVLHNF